MTWWADYGEALAILVGIEVAAALIIALCLRANKVAPARWWWWLLLVADCASPLILCTADTLLPDHPRNPGTVATGLELAAFAAMPLLATALARSTLLYMEGAAWPWRAAIVLVWIGQLGIDFLAVVASAQLIAGVSL